MPENHPLCGIRKLAVEVHSRLSPRFNAACSNSGRYDLSGKFELADVLEGEYSASAFAKANKLEQFSNGKTISVTKDLKGVVIDFPSRVGKIAYSQKLPEGFTRPAVQDVSVRLLDSKGAPIDPGFQGRKR